MTSRFRNNWAKEGVESVSSTFHSSAYRESAREDDFRREWSGDGVDATIYRDRSIEDRNGKSRGLAGRYPESVRDRKSPDRASSLSRKDKSLVARDDPEECPAPRERKTLPIGKMRSVPRRRHELAGSPSDEESLEYSPTNGNSSPLSPRTNGSAKRVNRRVEDSPIGSSSTSNNDRSGESANGTGRDRSNRRWTRNDEKNNYDKSFDRRTSDRSCSPIEPFPIGRSNGESFDRSARKSDRRTERLASPVRKFEDDDDDNEEGRRSSRRHADGRSYSSTEEYNGGTSREPAARPRARGNKCRHDDDDDEDPSICGKPSRARPDDHRSHRDETPIRGSNGARRAENGSSPIRHSDDENPTGRAVSPRKSHTRYKASPDEFDVQIYRYERALRAPRSGAIRDADLARKSSFKANESDPPRKSSLDEHQRSNYDPKRASNNYRPRNSETSRRAPEDIDHDCSKNYLNKTSTSESTRKSSTARNFLDTGPNANNNNNNRYSNDRRNSNNNNNNNNDNQDNHNNNNNSNNNNNNRNNKNNSTRKNGSHEKSESSSLRRDDDEDESAEHQDRERILWSNGRHSRPLTPPTGIEGRRDATMRNLGVSSLGKGSRKDESTRGVQDRNKRGDEARFFSGMSSGRRAQPLGWKPSPGDEEDEKKENEEEEEEDDDATNLAFSTIERNGTTVIRIGRNSVSPEPPGETRGRRRTSHRELVTAANSRKKYEDEAEDEDDELFFRRDDHRRGYRATRRLWTNRDAGVQITDLDEGQPCLHCGETCPGFSPHSWRKNCTSCKCPREAHDVCHEEWVSVRARLGLKGEGSNNYVGFDPRDRGLTWAPPGLSPSKVEEYFSMLPEISVPRIGTPGERHRDRQLATQLPKQDLARAYCRHLDSQHSASADDFMAARNEIALDIGTVKEILERGHKCGVCHEALKYGSLVVSASKLGLSYHPSCFQCTQCRELLVDLAYCVHDDALYCERHYAEQLKPRCAACDELIFSGEYTKAMNKDWHSGHFCCWQCDESLTGQRYVLRDEHPYCIKCYESVFANGCEECNKIIGIDSKDLSYKDKHWHEACFLCNKCRVSLVDKQFGSKVDKIYCGNCYDAQFASRCDGCGEIFRAGTKKMEYKTRQWHEKCFCCVVCKNPIGTKSFIPREQEIYCAGCYEDKFATRCVKCNKIITSGGVTYKNEPWHRDCFTCSNCNNSLAGQRFTSRDDKPYCAECFGELFAKRCTACTKPITGIGGTRFISFEDRHWHNNCFICAGCNTSLVGRGFITDGDDIICPECAKQKLTE